MAREQQLEELGRLGAEMRRLQKEYFAASRANAFRGNLLDECRAAERAYDAQLVALGITEGKPAPAQRSLFGEGDS